MSFLFNLNKVKEWAVKKGEMKMQIESFINSFIYELHFFLKMENHFYQFFF